MAWLWSGNPLGWGFSCSGAAATIHQDGAGDRHGAGLAVALPEPDHLINDQDRDHKHEQPRDCVSGQGVIVPPAPQPGVGQNKDHEDASHQRNGGGLPAA